MNDQNKPVKKLNLDKNRLKNLVSPAVRSGIHAGAGNSGCPATVPCTTTIISATIK